VQAEEKKADVEKKKNAPKRVFCRKYDGYEDFCKGRFLNCIALFGLTQLVSNISRGYDESQFS
jgi:hypothetical protein